MTEVILWDFGNVMYYTWINNVLSTGSSVIRICAPTYVTSRDI
jgi:hypothetical protein